MKNLLIITSLLLAGMLSGCLSEEEPFICDIGSESMAASGTVDGEAVCFRHSNSGIGFNENSGLLTIRLTDGITIDDQEVVFDLDVSFTIDDDQPGFNKRYLGARGDFGSITLTEGYVELSGLNVPLPGEFPLEHQYEGKFDVSFNNAGSPVEHRVVASFNFNNF